MSSVTAEPTESTSKRVIALGFAIIGTVMTEWSRAQKAQKLAEKYLTLSDEALAARGTTREAVIDRIRQVMTETI